MRMRGSSASSQISGCCVSITMEEVPPTSPSRQAMSTPEKFTFRNFYHFSVFKQASGFSHIHISYNVSYLHQFPESGDRVTGAMDSAPTTLPGRPPRSGWHRWRGRDTPRSDPHRSLHPCPPPLLIISSSPHLSGNLSGFPSGIWMAASSCRQVTRVVPSCGRTISKAHQNRTRPHSSNQPRVSNRSPRRPGLR